MMVSHVKPFSYGSREYEGTGNQQSNNLWVGNLTLDTTDSDLAKLFGKYGDLDSATAYSSRSFGFVYFKHVEDAVKARQVLQGANLNGSQIKIDFARPARPSKNLWVGGISQLVSKEDLENEFSKYGKIEDFKFLRDRNTAFVEYFRIEDAIHAKNMSGKQIGGEHIRVDFLRSQPSRREQWSNPHEGPLQGRGMGPSDGSNLPSFADRKGDSQPTKVLWVGYPPSVQMDEQMLHNAMILFGEIEGIKSFPTGNYSLVVFRSVEEARRAKEGLQGRLFNDPRITILFSNSDLAPGFYDGMKGSRGDMFFHEHPFRHSLVDMFGHNHPMIVNNFPRPLPPNAMLGPNMPMRPFGLQGGFTHMHPGSEHNDLADMSKNLMLPNWRRPSPPASGLIPSSGQVNRPPPILSGPTWDTHDGSHLERDPKRKRRDDSLPIDGVGFTRPKVDNQGSGMDKYGIRSVTDGGAFGPLMNEGVGSHKQLAPRAMSGRPSPGYPDDDSIWRGLIAKGGTPVCNARCVPIGKGIGTELPEVVNCSARTGLDMLAKHYADAVGFDIIFFLPDSEDDFASYTEFLCYLGSKNRAGVAKFNDGTTLFLVPPSDFLTNVLKVTGPERLYGVVLKLPPPVPAAAQFRQEIPQPLPQPHIDRQLISQTEPDYGQFRSKEEHIPPVDYNRVLHEDSKPSMKPYFPPSEPQSAPREWVPTNTTIASQAGITLTPELIASLTSLMPTTSQSSTPDTRQPALVSSTVGHSFQQNVTPSFNDTPFQGGRQDQHALEPAGHLLNQMVNHYAPHTQLPPSQYYPPMSNTPNYSSFVVPENSQYQQPVVNLAQQAALSSMPLANNTISSQGSHFSGNPQVRQQAQLEVASNTQSGYGAMHGADAPGLYSSPSFQPGNNPPVMSNHFHNANHSYPQHVNPVPIEKMNPELPSQMQQLQSVLSGAGQEITGGEDDKNKRYQSTLQFAANLLQQIQMQQQTNPVPGQGSGSQL